MFLPFSEKARQLAQNSGLFIDPKTLLVSREFIEKIITGQQKEVIPTGDQLAEVRKLATCKVILSLCPYYVVARFSENYAKLWWKYFHYNPSTAFEFAREVFPSLSVNDEYRIPVFEYLNAEESISFVRLSSGFVIISKDGFLPLLARQVERRIMSMPQSNTLPPEVQDVASQLSTQFALPAAKKGKNLEKEEIKKIRQGVAEGQRFYGCMKLSRACFADGLSLEQAKQVVLEYVKTCPPSKNTFTEKEALNCLEWTYRKGPQGRSFKASAKTVNP